MLKMFLTIALMVISVVTACAAPTPKSTTLAWDTYTDPNGKGFWVYWKDKGNTNAVYNDVNRTKITDVTKVSVLIDAIVAATKPSTMCFVLTAYDAAENESAYSNEACAFVGLPNPNNVRGQ